MLSTLCSSWCTCQWEPICTSSGSSRWWCLGTKIGAYQTLGRCLRRGNMKYSQLCYSIGPRRNTANRDNWFGNICQLWCLKEQYQGIWASIALGCSVANIQRSSEVWGLWSKGYRCPPSLVAGFQAHPLSFDKLAWRGPVVPLSQLRNPARRAEDWARGIDPCNSLAWFWWGNWLLPDCFFCRLIWK